MMADKDNEEYQFADLDEVNPGDTDYIDPPDDNAPPPSFSEQSVTGQSNMKRALFIVGLLVMGVIIIYKVASFWGAEKKEPTIVPVKTTQFTKKKSQVVTSLSQDTIPSNSKISQKLATLEMNQQSMRAEFNTSRDQLTQVSRSLNELLTQITALNQQIAALRLTVDAQAQEITRLTIRTPVARKTSTPSRPHAAVARVKYYLQAVIPGRAWLIGSNGVTLTVREGTSVSGYGIVKLIDPRQGRVLMSSGQVIRFSQEDS